MQRGFSTYCLFAYTAFVSEECGVRSEECRGFADYKAHYVRQIANWKWQVANFGTALPNIKLRK